MLKQNLDSEHERAKWLDRRQCREAIGCNDARFGSFWHQRFADGDVTKHGRKLYYRGSALLRIYADVENNPHKNHPGKKATDETDPLLVGSDTPALERYRLAKAELSELELAEKRKQLVSLDLLKETWGPVVDVMRKAIMTIEKDYGRDAGEVIDDAIDEACDVIERVVGNE